MEIILIKKKQYYSTSLLHPVFLIIYFLISWFPDPSYIIFLQKESTAWQVLEDTSIMYNM